MWCMLGSSRARLPSLRSRDTFLAPKFGAAPHLGLPLPSHSSSFSSASASSSRSRLRPSNSLALPYASPLAWTWARRKIWSTVALEGSHLPRHKRRYRNALLSLGFVAVVLAVSEYITSNYLKSSTPFRHSLELVQRSPEVQALLGMPIVPGLTVSSKRNMSHLRLFYAVHGPLGSADVEVSSVTSLKNVTLLRLVVTTKQRSIVLVDEAQPEAASTAER